MDAKKEHSWEQLLNQHGTALVLYARQYTVSHAEAEEAVQNGFIKFWRSRYAGAADPLPLLYVAVKRSALDMIRSRSRRKAREEKAVEEDPRKVAMFETFLDQELRRNALEEAMKHLPPEQKETLVMKIWGELTFEQIAKAAGISPNTAASRYRYGLAALRERLTGTEFEEV